MEIARKYISELKRALDAIDPKEIEGVVDTLMNAYGRKNSIYVIGNGGSATTASHFACDLGKGVIPDPSKEEGRFKVHSLTDNVPLMTAYGNDVSYEEIFAQPLRNFLAPKDILVAFTGSGNSKNIVRAVEVARERGAHNIGFLGFGGGKVAKMVDQKIIVDSNNYGVVEDLHLALEHMVCHSIRDRFENR